MGDGDAHTLPAATNRLQARASLLKLVPATQVMFGSDYPNAPATLGDSLAALRQLVQSGDMTDCQLQSIESETAVALFPRLRGSLTIRRSARRRPK